MESVTFVYALATEQERQAEALKNQKQNQLERYRHVIQRQKEKERAFLSFKKVEFLSRQETKLHASRRHSARARISDRLPEIKAKGQECIPKSGLLAARYETRNSPPFLYRHKTHLGTRYLSPNSTNLSSAETRKTSLGIAMPELAGRTCSSSNFVRSRTTGMNNNHKTRKGAHFEGETKVITRPVKHNYKTVGKETDSPNEIELKTFEKRGLNSPKCERVRVTKSEKGKLSKECNNQQKAGTTFQPSNKSHNLQSVETAKENATKDPGTGQVSWAVVARLIGLKLKFRSRQVHGTFQAPELEVLDPTLKNERRTDQETCNDPLKGVKGCRYLRMPNKK